MDPAQFLRDFLKPGRPVLMRGAARDWKWTRDWTKANFLNRFGRCAQATFDCAMSIFKNAVRRRVFTVGEIPYPKIFGLATREVSASEYVEAMADISGIEAPMYVFHSINGPDDGLLGSFPMFPEFLQVFAQQNFTT